MEPGLSISVPHFSAKTFVSARLPDAAYMSKDISDSEDEQPAIDPSRGKEDADFYGSLTRHPAARRTPTELSQPADAFSSGAGQRKRLRWLDDIEAPPFHCELCSMSVPQSQRAAHIRSTVHQFRLHEHESHRPVFFIPEHNIGYRLLADIMGWEGHGLGVRSQGPVEPVRTRVKNDRLGIGAPTRNRLAVTHTTAEHGKHGRSTYSADFEEGSIPRVRTALRSERAVRVRVAARERRRHRKLHDMVYRNVPQIPVAAPDGPDDGETQ